VRVLALEILFWLCAGLIVWTQVGYAAALAGLARVLPARSGAVSAGGQPPTELSLPELSLIVAAHNEETVIAAKVANALAQDYPRELLQVIVACDGCEDATAARAREAGADLVLELPRGGKIRAQDAAVQRARGEIAAFSDANSFWQPDAARTLIAAFADPRVGYACGQVRFVRAADVDGHADTAAGAAGAGAAGAAAAGAGTNQEGVYWRYELWVRALESRLSSITAGNGAIYATRRSAYVVVDPIMGHDLSLPFNMVKRGLRAVYVSGARASEKMVPSLGGEFARKRRMMSHTWPIVLRGGMLSPRGYSPGYALMILSHRVLRYSTPALHLIVLAANVALLASGHGFPYNLTLYLQALVLAGAALAGLIPLRAPLIARYYVLTTASLAVGLWDWLRHGTDAYWEAAEGTR
jgi:cellulose synthase/poly-beta-1,6-N-acetylglucosamine synthase-like glycosyltransferase